MKTLFLLSLFVPTLLFVLVDGSHAGAYATAVLADSPVAYWRLDTDASDSSAFGRPAGSIDGITGTATFGHPSLVPAEGRNGAIAFTGAGTETEQRRVMIPGFEKIGARGYSAEYWVNVTAYPVHCCNSLVSDGEGGTDFFMMNYLVGPGQEPRTIGAVRPHFGPVGTIAIATDATPLALNRTYYVVTTYDAAAGRGHVYFDGVSVLDAAVTATVPAPGTQGNNNIYIGRDVRSNNPSNFIIDEVALYDYPLTPAQVLNHYNIGVIPGPLEPFVITSINYDAMGGAVGLTWNSNPLLTYQVEASSALGRWFRVAENIESTGLSTTATLDLNVIYPRGLPKRLYFQVSPD